MIAEIIEPGRIYLDGGSPEKTLQMVRTLRASIDLFDSPQFVTRTEYEALQARVIALETQFAKAEAALQGWVDSWDAKDKAKP